MYSTWAFFFAGMEGIDDGLKEVERVVKDEGKIIIVDNYGEDEFSSFSANDIFSNVSEWVERGFDYHVIHTAFKFDSVEEAQRLLSFFFGENGSKVIKTNIEYKVVAFTKSVQRK
jgi:ubiquinone/menaquinone biosynthesis C-methylase UbiE